MVDTSVSLETLSETPFGLQIESRGDPRLLLSSLVCYFGSRPKSLRDFSRRCIRRDRCSTENQVGEVESKVPEEFSYGVEDYYSMLFRS